MFYLLMFQYVNINIDRFTSACVGEMKSELSQMHGAKMKSELSQMHGATMKIRMDNSNGERVRLL